MLQGRAELLSTLRQFFFQRSVMEVDVPVLARSSVTDINIESIPANIYSESGYLQTSPEYFMKRLLSQGAGDIFCLGKAFRNGEQGCRHNPEFSLLEWYRCGWDEHQLMDEIAELISLVFAVRSSQPLAITKRTYADCFSQILGIDPHGADLVELQEKAVAASSDSWTGESRANCLDLLFSQLVEPQLPPGLVFVYDYPACQSALAQLHNDTQGRQVSRRFEVFLNGLELANGYFELTDRAEQQQRFDGDNAQRIEVSKPQIPVDRHLLAALDHGMPSCAGVAMGVDRLLMQLKGADSITQVMPFSWDRC
jgi:lysyl-tRNA synthetase class 2